jgi:DNA-binding response OmpR family regulator
MDDRPHIVVVEDEVTQRDMLVAYLSRHQFRVSGAENGAALRRLVDRELPSLVMLDIGLPGEDGFALARWLRERSGRVGIIMVTAATDTVDRVVGLETGADDYIAKPFEPRELLARVKSVLRRGAPKGEKRSASKAATKRVSIGACQLDLDTHQLIGREGEEIPLTGMEFDLLRVFAEHPNRVLSRDQLLTLTRNREWEPFDRSIDIRIARLRRKIEADPEKPRTIKTVRGAGYIFIP